MTINELTALYETLSLAASYIIGFDLDGILYALTCKTLPIDLLKIETNSDHGKSIRLRIRSTKVKTALIASGAEAIGTVEDLAGLPYKNKGIAFERFVKIRNGYEWTRHDNRPFTEGGDMGTVQIKFDGATVSTVDFLERLALR